MKKNKKDDIMAFPESLLLPETVFKERKTRMQQVIFSAFLGIGIRSLIILGEFAGVFFFGSASLLMDGLASLLDVACSLCLIFFIKLASRPPDEDHPFGHGRYEPLAGFQLGVLLAFVGAGMLVQQVSEVRQGTDGGALSVNLWMIPFTAFVCLELSHYILIRIARKYDSPALAADAIHYRIDSISSLFACIALGFSAYFPQHAHLFDHSGAILISLFMIGLGALAIKNNMHQLMDKAPEKFLFEKVRAAAKQVSGVLETEKIRIQNYGPDAHVDIDVEVDPGLSVEKAHRISQEVRVEIQKSWPSVRDVTVHIEPYYPGDH